MTYVHCGADIQTNTKMLFLCSLALVICQTFCLERKGLSQDHSVSLHSGMGPAVEVALAAKDQSRDNLLLHSKVASVRYAIFLVLRQV